MSDTPHGYHGRYLHVDLSTQRSVVRELPADVLQQHIGGSGLGTWLLRQHTPHEIDALSPDAPLLFVFSPLVGSPLTTSAKFAVMAKSPLTLSSVKERPSPCAYLCVITALCLPVQLVADRSHWLVGQFLAL